MSEWQPIETAPKDGTWVLACGGILDVYPAEDVPPMVAVRWQQNWWLVSAVDAGQLLSYERPTHWMPLPAPPSQEQSRG